MRFSLGPVGDVDVDPGATLAECGPTLAALLGPLAGAPLAVGGVRLAPDQVAGVAPWVPGCHVTVAGAPDDVGGPDGAGRPDGPDGAPGADTRGWHLAVVAGPDAGALGMPSADGRLAVGRRPGRGLVLGDVAASRLHLVASGPASGGRRLRVLVRDAGSANGTQVRRARAAGWRRTRRAALRPGDRVRLGSTVLEVRSAADGPRSGDRSGDRFGDRSGDTAGDTAGGERGRATPALPRPATLVVPLVVAGVLAAVTGNVVFLLMAAAGPLAALVPAVLGARRTRSRRRRPPVPGLAPDAAATTVLLARGSSDRPEWWQAAREGLAVVGEPADRLAAARALVGAALLDPAVRLTLLHDDVAAPEWRWARWLEGRLGPAATARVAAAGAGAYDVGDAPHLVVSDGLGGWRADLERWWMRTQGRDRAALVLAGEPPAWCRWVLTTSPDGSGRLVGPTGARGVTVPAASPGWAEVHARRVAARAPATDDGAGPPGLPTQVGPGEVGLPRDVPGVLAAWDDAGPSGGRTSLRTAIGLAATGPATTPCTLDLVADGPHALVAGTTGSGKSELLQALVLGLALRHPPEALALVLLDFKGGAGLRPCRALPHVVGSVTDLDPEQATRALESLSAELRRREALLAAAGASDISDLRRAGPGGPALPRLVVVVDEFRALAEELPDFVPALVRLAAQGRSLGMHLVLATQRPGGAVTAQMRANLALRMCLRVTEPADSLDVVDVPDAAAIPARTPGRVLVRRADGSPELVQAFWAALPPVATTVLRPAAPWAAFGTGTSAGTPATPGTENRGSDPAHADGLAGLALDAARRRGRRAAPTLWSPPLPTTVTEADLVRATTSSRTAWPPDGAPPRVGTGHGAAPTALVLGLTDPAGAGGRGLLTWDAHGLLVVAGRSRSGRTTTARRAVAAALAAGRTVHVVGAGVAPPTPAPTTCTALGTTVDATDPRRLARLLTLLLAGEAGPGLLVVDDVAAAAAALDTMPRGAGAGLLERVAREGPGAGVAVLVTGHPSDLLRLTPVAAARLVLPVTDPADDAALGVPRDLGARRVPGRAVLVAGDGATRCQVALPAWPAGGADGRTWAPGGPSPGPLRLAPLPDRVPWPMPAPPGTSPGTPPGTSLGTPPGTVVVGLGGDDGGAVTVPLRQGVLVTGPPGSGRSTALGTLARGAVLGGHRVAVVATGGPAADAAAHLGAPCAGSPGAAADLVRSALNGGVDVLLVDDLDLLARAAPDLDDELGRLVHAVESGAPGPVLVGACRTDRAATAYRGAVAALRGTGALVVLAPAEPGSADVAGVDLGPVCDPARPRHPGRGALVTRGRATPVQVAAPGPPSVSRPPP